MHDSCLRSWLALSHMPGMYSQLFNKLVANFGSPQNILSCDSEVLKAAGLKVELRSAISLYRSSDKSTELTQKIEESLSWQGAMDNQFIVYKESTLYPELLREIPDSPPILYIKGDPNFLSLPQLAMVGSRNPGPVGRKNARGFAGELTKAGYVVSSGMALGVDSESHIGALDAGGVTLAVLGTGIDQLYPKQNRSLAERIIERGALVSEFPLGTWPRPANFPQRNRIISGLSQGTLVVEAALRSGSLITARFALEQGRSVFAIPGSIHSTTVKGCHSLIKDGAKLVEKVEDILEELGAFIKLAREQVIGSQIETVSKEEALVLTKIDYEPVSMDGLISSTGMNVASMSVILMELELKGFVEMVAGGYILSIS